MNMPIIGHIYCTGVGASREAQEIYIPSLKLDISAMLLAFKYDITQPFLANQCESVILDLADDLYPQLMKIQKVAERIQSLTTEKHTELHRIHNRLQVEKSSALIDSPVECEYHERMMGWDCPVYEVHFPSLNIFYQYCGNDGFQNIATKIPDNKNEYIETSSIKRLRITPGLYEAMFIAHDWSAIIQLRKELEELKSQFKADLKFYLSRPQKLL